MTEYDNYENGVEDLHSNVCYDLVRYVRSNTIRNEQQFLLTTLGYMTGFFEEADHFVSGVLIGTASSGKTHLQHKVETLFHDDVLYQATTGSDKSLIYDEKLGSANIASLDEMQKPSQQFIEILKSLHGGDEGFDYKSTRGSVKDGFDTETIQLKPMPYYLSYAQYDPDNELWDRLLKIPVHESTTKNRAVGAMSADHHHVQIEGDVEYGYQFPHGTKALQAHIAKIKQKISRGNLPGYVKLPTYEEYEWDAWEITEPIFNHNRTEVNRVYDMVFNLVRASALLNYQERDIEEIYHPKHGTREAIIAEPQDVANVLACREALVSTTHGLDDKRWAICRAIKNRGGATNEVEGISEITDYLKSSDAPLPPESELENLLEDLSDNYLVEIHPNAGDKGRDIYEFLGFDELGFARVPENEELFKDTFDPISGQNFLETHRELRQRLESHGDDVMGQADAGKPSGSSRTDKGSLSQFGGGSSRTVDLEPHEEAVRALMKRNLDGERVKDLSSVPVEGLLGLTDANNPDLDIDYDGTILDPEDSAWAQPDKDESWVSSVKDAKREVRRAVKKLVSDRVVRYETVHEESDEGTPIDATIAVLGQDDI